MAASMKSALIIVVFSSLLLPGALGEVICENLPENLCAFAVASSGKRCVLENYRNEEGSLEYTCTSSEVVVERFAGHIETDSCIANCGTDRKVVGISSDAFMAPEFVSKLCAPACYKSCPNIVDLYFNLAAGEGVFLPALCEKQKTNPHRAMLAILSSGAAIDDAVAAPPMASDLIASSPAPAPAGLFF